MTASGEHRDRSEGAYRRVLATPGVLGLVGSATLSALPAGMGAVALVLYVQHITGSFASAGVVTAAFTIGLGFTGPLLARLIDRFGTRPVVIPAAICESMSFALLVILGNSGADTTVLALVAALAGAAAPPTGGVLQKSLGELVPPSDLPTAYAIDAVQIEIIFIAGPLLAGILAATVGPGKGLLIAAPIATIGTVWFASQVPRPEATSKQRRPRGWAGALDSPSVRLFALIGIPMGATFGALDVSLPAFGAAHGAPAVGGLLAAALAVGSAIGGLAFGARPDRFGPAPRSFLTLSLVQAVTCLPLLLAVNIPMMFPLALLAAVCVAPLVTLRNQLVQKSAPPGTAVEAFTWMGLSLTLGSSLGSAVAGPLIAVGGWRAGIGVACIFPILALLTALTRSGRLEPAQ